MEAEDIRMKAHERALNRQFHRKNVRKTEEYEKKRNEARTGVCMVCGKHTDTCKCSQLIIDVELRSRRWRSRLKAKSKSMSGCDGSGQP